jgi:hypothetical protein
MRRRGVRVGNHRKAEAVTAIEELAIEEMNDPEMKRAVRTARLMDPDKRPADQLRDVAVLWFRDDRMVLTGIERVNDLGSACEYAQTWLCEWLSGTQTEMHRVRGRP